MDMSGFFFKIESGNMEERKEKGKQVLFFYFPRFKPPRKRTDWKHMKSNSTELFPN